MTATRACRYCKKRFTPSSVGRPPLYCSASCGVMARRKRQQPAYFMSGTDEWATPPELFAEWDARYHFTLDVCATASNAKCERYFTRADNALAQIWEGACWMNPPYGREIGNWVAKAADSAYRPDTIVVCLIPVRTDTAWWQRYVEPFAEVTFLAGRVRFNAAGSAPFPSCVAVFPQQFPQLRPVAETVTETVQS